MKTAIKKKIRKQNIKLNARQKKALISIAIESGTSLKFIGTKVDGTKYSEIVFPESFKTTKSGLDMVVVKKATGEGYRSYHVRTISNIKLTN